jgi:hypothetical protein
MHRHEMPTDKSDPLAHQNMRDRFYGKDDPVAQKVSIYCNLTLLQCILVLCCTVFFAIVSH